MCNYLLSSQGGRTCTGAQVAPAEKFGLDENFKPKHTLFCCELRFVVIGLWAKKVPFWVKNSVSWARSALLHGKYCIFHWVNFVNLRLRAKTTHLSRKLYKRGWRKFSWPFLPPTKGCQVLPPCSQLIVLSPLAEEFKRGEGPSPSEKGYKGNPEFRGDSESSTQGLNDPDDPWTNLEIGNDKEKDNRMAGPKPNLHRSFNVSNFDKDEKSDKDNPSQKESEEDNDKPDEEKEEESDHLPFNITTFEHDGGNSWWAVSLNIDIFKYINSLKMIYLDILHIWNFPTRENENCDLKSIPAPLHGRWQCDDNNNQQSDNNDNTCVLKCDTGYKTSTAVTVRLS